MPKKSSQEWTLQTGHIGLNVTKLERSRKFYQDVFDFKVMHESGEKGRKFVFLGDSENILLTLWKQSSGRFDGGRPGLHYLSFQLGSIDEVKQAEQKLHVMNVPLLYQGIVPHAEGTDSGGTFFEDPDGIRLEIFSPMGAGDRTAPVMGAPT
jgi:lactoylglutathione lyase